VHSSTFSVPPLSYLTCTANKCKVYFANSLATVYMDPDPYKILTFELPSLMSIMFCLRHSNDLSESEAL